MKKIAFLLFTVLLYSCNSIKVYSDKDSNVDFTQHKTLEYYGWAENSDKILNSLDKKRIESAFANEFAARGFSLAEKGKGDLIVSLYIVTEHKTEKVANTSTTHTGGVYGGYGGYYGYGPSYNWGGGHSYSTTTFSENEYQVGTLIVSAYDAKKKELIWEALGTKTVDENPKNRETKINSAVAKIMKEYPIQPLKK